MKIENFKIQGPLLVTPKSFKDERGFFMESYNMSAFNEATGLDVVFVQDNHSKSLGTVIRGLHYQLDPKAQGKLVRCVRGKILDVAVDIRKSSPTFGQYVGVELSEENQQMLWIPAGFAHGFATLTADTEVLYKTTNYYSAELDRGILWSDHKLNIMWPISGDPIISKKDSLAPTLDKADLFN